MRWIAAVHFPAGYVEDFLIYEPDELSAEIHAEELCRNIGGDSFKLEWMD